MRGSLVNKKNRAIGYGLLVLILAGFLPAAAGSSEILPAEATYDPSVPTPSEVLGQEIGRWHLRHDQLVTYLERLAASSDRLRLEEQGRTHEGRRQLLLIVTSPENHARLDEIQEMRSALIDPSQPVPSAEAMAELPSVAYLGYSIHGNEASGSNASALVAYHLAASEDPEVAGWLDESIVLIDPSLNPDGMGRFATWANMHRGNLAIGDPNHREHREGWPSGRTNHYWFDLNRDWLLLQHPESRARVRTFQHWKPNLVGDYHEMGSNSTYFFQPGVAERENPYKPQRNIELTRALAQLHARNLAGDGQLFYSGETFDDFYPGKGSTYPDLQGSVGVLFEQASARGHLQETDNGDLSFQRAIRNHFLTSLSMIEGAATMRDDLLAYQADFVRQGVQSGGADPAGAFLFGCPSDPVRCSYLVKILLGHQIDVRTLARGMEVDGRTFDPAWSWAVPLEQPQYLLIKALFERQTEFEDTIFYDVSSWTLPLAFGADSARLGTGRSVEGVLGESVDSASFAAGRFEPDPDAYAYLFDWTPFLAPRALNRVLEAGFRPRVATRQLQVETTRGPRDFDYGTIIVPIGDDSERAELDSLMTAAAERDGIDVWTAVSGLTPSGVDLGSPNVLPLEPVKLLLVGGRGVSSYEVGEAWYLLDHRFGIEVSLVEQQRLDTVDFADYTHLLMVTGSYAELGEALVEEIERWIRGGGVLVATKSAAAWAEENFLSQDEEENGDGDGEQDVTSESTPPTEDTEVRTYVDYERQRAAELIGGAIFEVELDRTHPIAFGYTDDRLPVFRNSTLLLEDSENPYERVAVYPGEPLLSGYASEGKQDELGGEVAVLASRLGRGAIVRIADNPNFRGFWYGTSKLYLNSIFFGPIVRRTSSPSDW